MTAPHHAPRVQVGLERVGRAGFSVRGLRIGLIANAASVTWDDRPALSVLRARGAHVVRLFAPEHGMGGNLGAGQPVGGGTVGGVQVVPLYQPHPPAPTRSELRGLDAVVFDLQDAGVRFYTYISTMILAETAAGRAGVRFIVLDRPNPLGGERIAGPVATGAKTLLSTAPGPLLHGLTAGEMARFVNARLTRPARLTVVPMKGWRRWMTWPDTGRRWVPPSPNLRSPEAALAYPGTALLEGTTVSEGRGTPTPFLRVGAPWVDVRGVLREAATTGVALRSTTFTPRASAAAPHPKYLGQRCRGIRIRIADPRANTFAAGLALLRAVRTQPGFRWLDSGAEFDTEVGTPRLRAQLDAGRTLAEILASERATVAAWRKTRRAALLY